jgi:hypothetical protein
MIRLTYQGADGTWGVAGMNPGNESEKLYLCCTKLRDYENTGFSPDEITELAEQLNATRAAKMDLEYQIIRGAFIK